MFFDEWIETPAGREAYRKAQDREISEALRLAYEAGQKDADDYYAAER